MAPYWSHAQSLSNAIASDNHFVHSPIPGNPFHPSLAGVAERFRCDLTGAYRSAVDLFSCWLASCGLAFIFSERTPLRTRILSGPPEQWRPPLFA